MTIHRRNLLSRAALAAACSAALPAAAQEQLPLDRLRQKAEGLARLPGEPGRFEAAGVTRGEIPLWSLENAAPPEDRRRRVVLVGGLDGDDRSVRAIWEAISWFKTEAPQAVREDWILSAVPCGNPEGWRLGRAENGAGGLPAHGYPPLDGFFNDAMNPEARYLWRWISFQAPDMVMEVYGGSAIGLGLGKVKVTEPETLERALTATNISDLGLTPAVRARSGFLDGGELLRRTLSRQEGLLHSPAHREIIRRVRRSPLEVARLLARHYPQQASHSYIPAVAWINRLRLARALGDEGMEKKVWEEIGPWLEGKNPALPAQIGGAALAGSAVFAEIGGGPGAELARKAAREFEPVEPDGLTRHGKFWCEDMFMAALLLSRTASYAGSAGQFDLLGRTLTRYVARLQQPSGLFHHAADGPWCWGRGNGFASLGLAEALTRMPADHPARAGLAEAHRRQAAALPALQTPEGSLRQVIDHPESYREITATAMNLAAMARGIRLGWLDAALRPHVLRAWQALSARVADNGRLADVCTGTGSGATLRHYYDRPAIFGMDDRGGAMSLLAAVETALLEGELKEKQG